MSAYPPNFSSKTQWIPIIPNNLKTKLHKSHATVQ